jgi:hypothetical protein
VKIERTKSWWMQKAAEETVSVGARSKLTMELPKLTREQKRLLRKLSKRPNYDPDYVVGGPQMPWWRKVWRRISRLRTRRPR